MVSLWSGSNWSATVFLSSVFCVPALAKAHKCVLGRKQSSGIGVLSGYPVEACITRTPHSRAFPKTWAKIKRDEETAIMMVEIDAMVGSI